MALLIDALHVKSKEHHIAVGDGVLLAFGAHGPSLAGSGLAPKAVVVRKLDGLGADEALLEVGVDHAGRLRRGGADLDGPGAHFLLAGGEVGLQAEQLIAGADHPVEAGFFHAQVGQEVGFLFIVQFGDLRFDLGADRHHRGVFLRRLFAHQVQQRIVVEAVLFHVGDVHGGFEGEQVEAADCLALVIAEVGGARRFMAANKELLRRYPELRADIDEAVKQGDNAERMGERIASRIAALENTKRSAMAKFVGASGEKTVNAIFEAKNPITAARKIANAARKDKTGRAMAGVKGAFTDHLIASAMKTKGSQAALEATALNRSLNDPRTKRALSQIFNESEMSRLRLMGRELAKLQSKNAADIGPDLSGAKANRIIEWVSRIAAARHGAQLGGGSGGSIQTAQMASSRVKEALGFLTSDKASRLMADAVTDPDLFKALLTQTAAPGAEKRALPYFIPYLVGGTSVAVNE